MQGLRPGRTVSQKTNIRPPNHAGANPDSEIGREFGWAIIPLTLRTRWLKNGSPSMRITFVLMAALVAMLGVGCCSVTAPPGSASRRDAALRQELLSMVDADQRVRQGFGSQMEPEKVARMQAVDAKHTARMKAIIAEHGWPGRSLVGEEGAHAAWLLVQHAA